MGERTPFPNLAVNRGNFAALLCISGISKKSDAVWCLPTGQGIKIHLIVMILDRFEPNVNSALWLILFEQCGLNA